MDEADIVGFKTWIDDTVIRLVRSLALKQERALLPEDDFLYKSTFCLVTTRWE